MKQNRILQEKIVKDILGLWNHGGLVNQKNARNKLKMAVWILNKDTYNYLAVKMGVLTLPTDKEEEILLLAQKQLGGKIVKN